MKESDQHFVTCEKTEKRNKLGRIGDTGDPQLSNLISKLLTHFQSDTEQFRTI